MNDYQPMDYKSVFEHVKEKDERLKMLVRKLLDELRLVPHRSQTGYLELLIAELERVTK